MTTMNNTLQEMDRVQDRVRLHRQVSNLPVVIVEGPGDALTLKDHLKGISDIFPAAGKSRVLAALEALQSWKFDAFLGIVDADFDDPSTSSHLDEVLVYYDFRDLEGMLINLGVLETVLEHHGSKNKLDSQGGSKELVDRLKAIVTPVSAIRKANATYSWGIPFSDVSIESHIQLKTLSFELEKYCLAACRSTNERAEPEAHRIEMEMILDASREDLHDARGPRGKDVLAVAGVALRRIAGSLGKNEVSEDRMVSLLHGSAGLALDKSSWLKVLRERVSRLRVP